MLISYNKKLSTHKKSWKEYDINVLTIRSTEYIIKVVGVKPFRKRLSPKTK